MSLASYTIQQAAPPANAAPQSGASGEIALLMMGLVAGASMTKAARKQYRALTRKMAWQALGFKLKSLFGKKDFGEDQTVAGMPLWLFIVVAVGAAALGLWLFGLMGFLLLLALAAIIYLLVKKSNN